MNEEKQIEEMAMVICTDCVVGQTRCKFYTKPCDAVRQECEVLYKADYRKQSEVIDEFAEKLKEAPIKCGLPLFGLSTKEEIEEYFNGIMLQVRDAIDNIAKEMKGGVE